MKNLLNILKTSVDKLPQLRFAYGILGLLAVVIIIRTFNIDFSFAIVSVVGLTLIMCLLVIFSRIVDIDDKYTKRLALTLAWSVIGFLVLLLGTLFSCFFFNKPISYTQAKNIFFGTTDTRQVTIRIAVASSSAEIIEKVLKDYEKYQTSVFKDRGINFSLRVDRYTNEQYHNVMNDIKEGPYDIMMLDNPFIYKYENQLTDLNSIDCESVIKISASIKSKFIPSLLSVCEVKSSSKLIGLPFTGNVLMMLVNQEVIRTYNINDIKPRSIPVNLNPIINKILFYKDSLRKLGLTSPISVRTDIRTYLPEIFWELLRAQGYQDKIQGDTCVIIEKAKADSALSWLKIALGRDLDRDLTAIDNTRLLSEGKIAMAFGWTNWIGTFLKENETSQIEVLKGSNHPLLGSWVLCIPQGSNNKCQALRIIIDLCTNETIQNSLAEEGITPVYSGFSYSLELSRRSTFWNKNARNIEDAIINAKPRPRVINWKQIEDLVAEQLINSLNYNSNELQSIPGYIVYN